MTKEIRIPNEQMTKDALSFFVIRYLNIRHSFVIGYLGISSFKRSTPLFRIWSLRGSLAHEFPRVE